MVVPILTSDGEVEDEIEIDLCCAACASCKYKWNSKQFDFVRSASVQNEPIQVPEHIDNSTKFVAFIASRIK